MYYLIFAIGIIASFIKKINERVLLLFISVCLAVFAIFRYGVGADYFAYKYLFSHYLTSPFLELISGTDKKEVAFSFMGSIFRMMGANYQIFIACIAVLIIVFIYKVCVKYSKKPVLSLFIYYSLFYLVWVFSGYRQGIVLAIGVYALLRFQKRQDMWKFLVLVLALSLVHLSALILILYYFLAKIEWTHKKLLFLLVSSLILAFVPFGQIVTLLGGFPILDRVVYYAGSHSYGLDFLVKIAPRIIFALIAIYFYLKSPKAVNDNNISILFIIAMCMYLAFSSIDALAGRTSIYGFVFIILLIPDYVDYIRKNYSRLIYSLACVVVVIFSFLFLLKNINTMRLEASISCPGNYVEILPYTNIFDKQNCVYSNRYYEITDGRGM